MRVQVIRVLLYVYFCDFFANEMIFYYRQKAGSKLALKREVSHVLTLSELTRQVMHAPKCING